MDRFPVDRSAAITAEHFFLLNTSIETNLAKTFRRAKPEDITEILETLCALGHARPGTEKGTYLK